MKRVLNILVVCFLCGAFHACGKVESIGQQPIDKIPPGPVSNVTVKNTPGGAVIRYELPGDEDLLYVKAVYTLKNGEAETKSSIYADSLEIEGFGDTNGHEVKLYAVDRSRNESTSVTTTVNPLTPEVITIANTLDVWDDFGGMSATWTNVNKSEVAVALLMKNQNDEYMPLNTFYTSGLNGKGSVRGYEANVPLEIAAYIEDRWGNLSETKYYTIRPVFETQFEKSKFAALDLPTDGPHLSGYPLTRIWDGNTTDDGGIYGSSPGTGRWPQWVTIDMGQVGTVSRILVYQRVSTTNYIWYEGNLRRFEIYGQEELDMSGSWDSWTLLSSCESKKPSGLPIGQMTDEDEYVARNGEEFTIYESGHPEVRYIRIKVLQTWASGGNFQIQEINFYGQPRGMTGE